MNGSRSRIDLKTRITRAILQSGILLLVIGLLAAAAIYIVFAAPATRPYTNQYALILTYVPSALAIIIGIGAVAYATDELSRLRRARRRNPH